MTSTRKCLRLPLSIVATMLMLIWLDSGSGSARAELSIPCPVSYNTNSTIRWDKSLADYDQKNYLKQPRTIGVLVVSPITVWKPSDIEVLLSSDGKEYSLRRKPDGALYEPEMAIPDGTYLLSAKAPSLGLSAPKRYVSITSTPRTFVIHLGRDGSDFFAIGPALLPFRMSENIVAVFFENGAIDAGEAARTGSDIAGAVGIKSIERVSGDPSGTHKLDKVRTLLFDIGAVSLASKGTIIETIQGQLDRPARIATAINYLDGPFRAIDRRFVIHFSKEHYGEAESWMSELKAVKLRSFHKDSKLWLIELPDSNHTKNIAQLLCLADHGVLDVAEPDLIYELIDHDIPPDWPSDPRYFNRQAGSFLLGGGNHGIQTIREAWTMLTGSTRVRDPKIGKPSVHVALFDSRLRTNFQDIQCSAADGTPQIADCFDTNVGGECTAPPPGNSHGAGVSGIAGACTNNRTQISAVAPGVHFLFLERPGDTSSEDYAAALLWMAGLPCTPGQRTCTWRPIKQSPDVINGSHGMSKPSSWSGDTPLTIPTWTRCAFNKLVTSGRGNKGTILVYSAGNSNGEIEVREPYAASKFTIAVSNCQIMNSTKVRLYRAEDLPPMQRDGSNIGYGIDICAIGDKVPTLQENCGGAADFCYMRGTSASAPTVSGVVALMLSAMSDLSWYYVAEILRTRANRNICDQSDFDGRFDFLTGHSRWYGFGLLDAYASVQGAYTLYGTDLNPAAADPICD